MHTTTKLYLLCLNIYFLNCLSDAKNTIKYILSSYSQYTQPILKQCIHVLQYSPTLTPIQIHTLRLRSTLTTIKDTIGDQRVDSTVNLKKSFPHQINFTPKYIKPIIMKKNPDQSTNLSSKNLKNCHEIIVTVVFDHALNIIS